MHILVMQWHLKHFNQKHTSFINYLMAARNESNFKMEAIMMPKRVYIPSSIYDWLALKETNEDRISLTFDMLLAHKTRIHYGLFKFGTVQSKALDNDSLVTLYLKKPLGFTRFLDT